MENQKMASEKQVKYLEKLGYKGDTSTLTSEEATALIGQLSGKTNTSVATRQNNGVSTQTEKKPFSSFMATVGSKLVANTITDKKRETQFIANIVSAVSNNPVLQECDQVSVIAAGLQAEALHFPVNNALGYCYLVPFNDKKSGMKKAQFQIGYKGYIQLAIRSGQYRNIDAIEVKEGEIGRFNPIEGQEYNWIQNPEERLKAKTIGYLAFLTLNNGFHKEFYMSKEAMEVHADTYSQAFKLSEYKKLKNGEIPEKDLWKYSSFWYKDFTEMAKKTVLRQLLSKWGIMSVEMQEAYQNDMAAFDRDAKREYIDSKDFENSSIQEVMSDQMNMNASEPLPFDEDTGEIEEANSHDGLFSEFINQK